MTYKFPLTKDSRFHCIGWQCMLTASASEKYFHQDHTPWDDIVFLRSVGRPKTWKMLQSALGPVHYLHCEIVILSQVL